MTLRPLLPLSAEEKNIALISAHAVAYESADLSTQVGAAILGRDPISGKLRLLSAGTNHFTDGRNAKDPAHQARDVRYTAAMGHAEYWAIERHQALNDSLPEAERVRPEDTVMAVTHLPCERCLKNLQSLGYQTIVVPEMAATPEQLARWGKGLRVGGDDGKSFDPVADFTAKGGTIISHSGNFATGPVVNDPAALRRKTAARAAPAVPPEKPLVVAVSSRVLFDLDEDHQQFLRFMETEDDPIAAWEAYREQHRLTPVEPGSAYYFVRDLLRLNRPGQSPVVEIVMVSRNDPITGARVLNGIEQTGIRVHKARFLGGHRFDEKTKAEQNPVLPALQQFNVDLFLTADEADARVALSHGFATAMPQRLSDTARAKLAARDADPLRTGPIALALDIDNTLAAGSDEWVFKNKGMCAFSAWQERKRNVPLEPGPLMPFIEKCLKINQLYPRGQQPFIFDVITVRDTNAGIQRVSAFLQKIGLRPRHANFMGASDGGQRLNKGSMLAPDIAMLFDDGAHHIAGAPDSPRGWLPADHLLKPPADYAASMAPTTPVDERGVNPVRPPRAKKKPPAGDAQP